MLTDNGTEEIKVTPKPMAKRTPERIENINSVFSPNTPPCECSCSWTPSFSLFSVGSPFTACKYFLASTDLLGIDNPCFLSACNNSASPSFIFSNSALIIPDAETETSIIPGRALSFFSILRACRGCRIPLTSISLCPTLSLIDEPT